MTTPTKIEDKIEDLETKLSLAQTLLKEIKQDLVNERTKRWAMDVAVANPVMFKTIKITVPSIPNTPYVKELEFYGIRLHPKYMYDENMFDIHLTTNN